MKKEIVEVERFVADDGEAFAGKDACARYEAFLSMKGKWLVNLDATEYIHVLDAWHEVDDDGVDDVGLRYTVYHVSDEEQCVGYVCDECAIPLSGNIFDAYFAYSEEEFRRDLKFLYTSMYEDTMDMMNGVND